MNGIPNPIVIFLSAFPASQTRQHLMLDSVGTVDDHHENIIFDQSDGHLGAKRDFFVSVWMALLLVLTVLTFLTIDLFPYFPKPWRHVRPFTICVLMQLPTKIITKYLSNPLKLPAVAGIPYLPIFLIFKGWTVPSTYFKGCHRNRWVFLTTDYWPFTAPLISNHFHHCMMWFYWSRGVAPVHQSL